MRKPASFLPFFLLLHTLTWTQNNSRWEIGTGFQVHADGFITDLHLTRLARNHHAYQVRMGYHRIPFNSYKGFWEEGDGIGGAIAYRYYFHPVQRKFFASARVDLWAMTMYSRAITSTLPVEPPTRKLVIIPTLETGYTFKVAKQFRITPLASVGVKTSGGSSPIVFYQDEAIYRMGINFGFGW